MGHRRSRPKPTLTSAIVSADDRLWGAIDRVLRHDPELASTARVVLAAQEGLGRIIDKDGWDSYLIVEAAHNARLEAVAMALVRWAFSEGLTAGQQRGGA